MTHSKVKISEEIPNEFRPLTELALAQWAPASALAVLKDLVGGRSSASVMLVDIDSDHDSSTSSPISGHYVLKLDQKQTWDPPEPTERERHAVAEQRNTIFSKKHIPHLVASYENNDQIALLYELAGLGLVNLTTANGTDAGELERVCRQLSTVLLSEFNLKYQIEPNVTAAQTLSELLGYRLDEKKAAGLHAFARAETKEHKVFVCGGRILVNPLWFCKSEAIANDRSQVRLLGLLHGDLHPNNVLIHHQGIRSNFWLIDFALSRLGPLGYDHSYLELALILQHLQSSGPERVFAILEALDAAPKSEAASKVAVEDLGLLKSLRSIRAGVSEWQKKNQKNRADTVLSQSLINRVAVSLNWANKPLPINQRRLSFAYGSWAASRYLELFQEDEWLRLNKEADTRLLEISGSTTSEQYELSGDEIKSGWNQVWEQMARFNRVAATFVLVTGSLEGVEGSASLGFLPWSAVIDFDPKSDVYGLCASVSPVMEKLRSVTNFGKEALPVDFERGTAWLMANGWPTRNETIPTSLREWRRDYLPSIRNLCTTIHRKTAPRAIKVLILPGEGLSQDKLERVLEVLDEIFMDAGQITLVGNSQIGDPSILNASIEITTSDFVSGVRELYGVQEEANAPEIPSADGVTAIPIERLRNLEEDLEILHSRILIDSATQAANQDDFWKGTPPTWADLHANRDIGRDIHSDLISTLENRLYQSRNHTVELRHSPGAGGTTAALRAAWALHSNHPVAVLRRMSKWTLDRVDQLFQIAQRPVLLVADASIISPSIREELYRGLVGRNSRVVILYVNRTTKADPEKPLTLFDPMPSDEAEKFYNVFSKLTYRQDRRQLLSLISKSANPHWERYRSPFFFGLVTYDRNFTSIDRYVHAYLSGTGYRVSQVMRFLALVTRYSQVGLDETLFSRLLGLQQSSEMEMEEMVGEGPSKLVVRQGRFVRLMHPLIAEEVLRQLLGGGERDLWKKGLKDLAIDLIHEVVRLLGNDAEETYRLFEHLFIRRDDWFGGSLRRHFSDLIEAIPSKEGQHQVLQLLTEVSPSEAHFWNHLGRHEIYRMRQDYSLAEKYLETAVELAPDDRLHHHSLGMVRRFWIKDVLNNLPKSQQSLTIKEAFDEIHEMADAAAVSFRKARELGPGDDHGYITHIQLILEIAERLVKIGGGTNFNTVNIQDGEVGKWLRTNLVEAEELLAQVQHLRAEAKPSDYELDCVAGLTGLYGSFKDLIETWEGMLAHAPAQSNIRRALATAYYAKRSRHWAAMDEAELRRIVDLMEDNLREDPANEHDLRMWFQAYKRLPDFTYLQALDRLQAWASRSDAVDAYYYLYVLHFLLWTNRTPGSNTKHIEEQISFYLDKCKQGAIGRRGQSYEWLGIGPSWCPLVHHSELGEFDRSHGFYPKTDRLAFYRGTIETIKGPQAGTIRLGGGMRAFFVPGLKFWQSQNINDLVKFYLGFSYDGFRAWSTQDDSLLTHSTKSIASEAAGSLHETAPVETSALEKTFPTTGKTGSAILRERVKNFILDTIAASENRGQDLYLTSLGKKLSAYFREKGVHIRLGFKSLSDLIGSFDDLAIQGAGFRKTVFRRKRLDDQSRRELASLKKRVESLILNEVDNYAAHRKTLRATEIGSLLRREFPTEPVHKLLGYNRVTDLLRSMKEIICKDENNNVIIQRSRQTVDENESDEGRPISFQEQVESFIIRRIKEMEKDGKKLYVNRLISELRSEFPGTPVHSRLGFNNVVEFLRSSTDLRLEGRFPNSIVRIQNYQSG